MRVIIEKNYDELSRWAARHVVETIKAFQLLQKSHSY